MSSKVKVRIQNIIYVLSVDDIIYCESNDSGSTIHKLDHTTEHINASINELERKLSAHFFWRTDGAHLVNLNCLEEIPEDDNTKLTLIDKSKVPIEKTKRKSLIEALEELR